MTEDESYFWKDRQRAANPLTPREVKWLVIAASVVLLAVVFGLPMLSTIQ